MDDLSVHSRWTRSRVGCLVALIAVASAFASSLLIGGTLIGILPRRILVRVRNEGATCTRARPVFIEKRTLFTVCDGETKDWAFRSRGSEFLHVELQSEEAGSSDWSCEYLDGMFKLSDEIEVIIVPGGAAYWRWLRRPDIARPCSSQQRANVPDYPDWFDAPR